MDDPVPEWKDMAVLLLLIHGFGSDLRILEKSLLVPFTKDQVLVIVVLFEVKVGRASLINDTPDMTAVILIDVR